MKGCFTFQCVGVFFRRGGLLSKLGGHGFWKGEGIRKKSLDGGVGGGWTLPIPLVLEGKTGKLIPESLRLEFLDKFFANNFALSNAEDSTYWPLNRGGITDLPLLRALLAIRHASRHPSFWEVMISFVLVAYASLAASRTFLQWPLACLNFPLDS